MKRHTRRSFLLLAGTALSAALCSMPPADAARSKTPKRVLVVNHTAGFHHSSTAMGAEIIKKLGDQTELWTTEVATSPEEVGQKLTTDNLKNVDLVIFENTTGELPVTDVNKKAFMEWLRAGHGFVGMHAATDTFYQWADYGAMIGGYFDGHPWHEEVTLKVENTKFPGLKPFQESSTITDEIYQFRNYSRDDKHVILSIDNASIDVTKGKREDKDYAVAWAKMEGKGRVFYTSLGHREEVWNDPRYQEHITGAIKWAAGIDKTKIKIPKPANKNKAKTALATTGN